MYEFIVFNDWSLVSLGREGSYILSSSSESESDAMVPDDLTAMVAVKEGRRRPTGMRKKRSRRSKGKKRSAAGKKCRTLIDETQDHFTTLALFQGSPRQALPVKLSPSSSPRQALPVKLSPLRGELVGRA